MPDEESKLEQARRPYIQSLAETMEMYGLSPSMGRLYGIMYFHDEPMTLDEMRSHTGMSKTSMSTGVRALSDLKLVHKKWQKGMRKDLYEAEHDPLRSFIEFFCHLWEKEIEINKKGLMETKKALYQLLEKEGLSKEEKTLCKRDLEKIKEAQRYYAWLKRLVDTFENGEIFDKVPIPDEPID